MIYIKLINTMKNINDIINESTDWKYGLIRGWTNNDSMTFYNVVLDKKFQSEEEAKQHLKSIKNKIPTSSKVCVYENDKGLVEIRDVNNTLKQTIFYEIRPKSYIENFKWCSGGKIKNIRT